MAWEPQTPYTSAGHVTISKKTRGERLPTLRAQPLVPDSGISGHPVLAELDPESPRENSPPNACVVESLLATNVDQERFTENQASTPKSAMNPVPQKASNMPVAVVPSTSIEADGLTSSQALTLNLSNLHAANPIRQASSPWPSLTVAVVPPLTTPQEISFLPTNPFFRGYISKPEGRPSFAGGYSDVWRCRVWFFVASEALPREVAVKVLRSVLLGDCNSLNARARLQERLKQEARTWVGLDHPHILPLIGWTEEPSLSLISPWCERGSLDRYPNNLSEFERVRLLLGVAKGLEYLHCRRPPVVHGDIKPENILLSNLGEPLLADFGLATILGEEDRYTFSHRVGGSTPWMSPECMIGEPRSCQSDIYSFGSLAFWVLTTVSPHAGLTNNQITLKVCNHKDPKDPVEDWSEYPQLQGPVKDLLKECWARSPNARPSTAAVVQRLSALLESYGSGTPVVPSELEMKKSFKVIWPFFAAGFFIMTLCKWAIQ